MCLHRINDSEVRVAQNSKIFKKNVLRVYKLNLPMSGLVYVLVVCVVAVGRTAYAILLNKEGLECAVGCCCSSISV